MSKIPTVDAIVIALDVGKSVSVLHDYEEKSFFEQAKDCVSWIIQRKIISQRQDVLSLLLFGSQESNIPSAPKSYKNICAKFDFQLASWDMLKFVMKEITPTSIESDWYKALVVSTEMLKTYDEFNPVKNKKIVIFSDFSKPASNNFDSITKTIEDFNIEVTIIGPDHVYSLSDSDESEEPSSKKCRVEKSLERIEGEKIVLDLWKKVPENIIICPFESALKQLCSYTPRQKRVNHWQCVMDIGEVNINISMLKKTDPKQPKKFFTKCFKPNEDDDGLNQNTSTQDRMVKSEETAPVIKDKVMHYKHESGENDEIEDVEVKAEDTIEGFRYGATIIPFSEEDKTAMEYKPGPKSFSVLGFTHISNVPYYLLSGECSYVVVPRKNDKNAEVALSAIIQGMKKMECLAIVRKVYTNDRGLSLGILYPTIEEIFSDETDEITYREYLLFVELAFQDDVKSIDFPSLERVSSQITQKQYNAIDNLIDKMSLMKADKGLRGEPCEAFDLPFLHDFKEQFFQHCVIQRGLYPEEPLPTSMPPFIKKFIDVPQSVEEKCKPVFNEIKELFKIEKVESDNLNQWYRKKSKETSKNDTSEESYQKNLEHFPESVIANETNSIICSWMVLFQKGFPADKELEDFFIKVASAKDTEKPEILTGFKVVITKIREMYLNPKRNPEPYNLWMRKFKKFLNCNTRIFIELWESIVSGNIGLISKSENSNSNVTEEEAKEFLLQQANTCEIAEREQSDLDLLDELQAEQMDIESLMF